ncbi:MAG: hypothetical protein DWI57_01710 [Chloroflexi bacterium]|nr:MAG: hypothetical protein DWI57_01710 [Chloroflexota bacterium]
MENNAPYILKGNQLAWARLTWMVIALAMFGVVMASWPPYVRLLNIVCETCRMTPVYAETLQASGVSVEQWVIFQIIPNIIVLLGWMGMGTVIFLVKSNDRRALLFSALLIIIGASFGGTTSLLADHIPAWVWAHNIINYASFPCLVSLIYLFPNTAFKPRGLAWLLGLLCVLFIPIPFANDNFPIAYNFIFLLSFVISCIVVPVYRYRRVMTFNERQQTKWVIFGIVLAMAGIATTLALVANGPISCGAVGEPKLYCDIVQGIGYSLSPLMIPIFIGIGILRSRLWDIDILIRRTLQYTLLTGLLALVYFGSVVLLQSVFDAFTGDQSPAVIVLSTLLIAAIFTPLRRRVQDVIDRRFFRKKYDAAQVLAAFAITARDETDLAALTGELQRVVQETLQPEGVSVWLKPTQTKSVRSESTIQMGEKT